jgi:hypothetical protein
VEPTLTRIELHTHIARLSTEDGIRYATRQATRAVERFARAPMARLLPFVGKRSVDAADSTDILVEDLRAAEAIQRAMASPSFAVGPMAQEYERAITIFQQNVLDHVADADVHP